MTQQEDLRDRITARVPREVKDSLHGRTVGIAGCGGLGSNIAVCLARTGISGLVLVDFDTVEHSNLNRQYFDLDDVGRPKCEALRDHIARINPTVKVEAHILRITSEDIVPLFGGCDAVCEAFDDASEKAMFLTEVMERLPGMPLVCGSGMSGIGDPSGMSTRRLTDRVFVCGDGTSTESEGLAAPRVAVCAGLMANKVLQILTHLKE